MGLGIAQMALLSGANDAGSTMMEENVVSASGTSKISLEIEYKIQSLEQVLSQLNGTVITIYFILKLLKKLPRISSTNTITALICYFNDNG